MLNEKITISTGNEQIEHRHTYHVAPQPMGNGCVALAVMSDHAELIELNAHCVATIAELHTKYLAERKKAEAVGAR